MFKATKYVPVRYRQAYKLISNQNFTHVNEEEEEEDDAMWYKHIH